MNIKEQYKILEFGDLGDERGKLVVVEGNQDIPFDIKRVFYMYGSDNEVIRGQHANRNSEFVLINVSGTSKVRVDNGFEEDIIELNRPRMGLYLPTMLWICMSSVKIRFFWCWQIPIMTAVNISVITMNF